MEKKFIEREWDEDIIGELDKHGFFTTPNGSFWDPDYVYFNREGYDKHGGYYDLDNVYYPGENWNDSLQCYNDELDDLSIKSPNDDEESYCSEYNSYDLDLNNSNEFDKKYINEENENEEEEIEDANVKNDKNITHNININQRNNLNNNNFENFHLFCNEHISNEIIGLCIDNNCKNNKLMCCDCIFQYHVKHSIVSIKDVIKQYTNLSEMTDNLNNEIKPIIIEKKQVIIKRINTIIDNLFNNCLKCNEMNDYLKIKNDLQNLNEKYNNSSNLENEQELSELILNFWKSYSQKKINELFSNIKDKLNQNFDKLLDKIEKNLLNINLNN